MTKRRGGKTALIIVACITVVCTVFIGCELGGVIDVSSNIGPSDTSSQPDEPSPYDVEMLVEKAMENTISEDAELMTALRNEIGGSYVTSAAFLEDVRAIKFETVDPYGEYDAKTQIVKTSFFVVSKAEGKELVLMQDEFSYYSKDGLVTSKTVDVLFFSMMDLDNGISVEDLQGAELVFAENSRVCAVYLPSKNSMLCNIDDFKLVEIKNVDQNDLPIVEYRVTENLTQYQNSDNDAFVTVRNPKNERHFAYYDAQNGTLTKLSDYEAPTLFYSSDCDMGEQRVAMAFKDALAIYDFSTDNPYTPISVITKEDMGVELFEPLWSPVVDRNDDKRFLMIFKDENGNLGFVTFDYDGNLSNCFVTDLPIVTTNDVYPPSFVGNIAYFSHNSDEYLRRAFRKYAVDVRKGKNNIPQMTSEEFAYEANISPDEFRYDVSANAYPFVFNGSTEIAMNDGFRFATKQNAQPDANYYFISVSYDAQTERVEAYATTFSGYSAPYIKGELSVEEDGVYIIPYDLDYLPVPAKTKTEFVKIKIDTNDLTGLKEYLSTFKKDNVTVSFAGMKIVRENGELSYLGEVREMFNGDHDYVERKNKELELLKAYGAFSEGMYEIRQNENSAFRSYVWEPAVYITPLSPINYDSFKDTKALLDWYAMYKHRDQVDGVSTDDVKNTMVTKFSGSWTFEAEEFEKTVTQYFDVTVDFLRDSNFYDPGTKTYSYVSASTRYLMTFDFLKSIRNGNVMQISGIAKGGSHSLPFCLTVQLDDDSFRFVDAKFTDAFEIPSVFVTNLVPIQ